MWRTARSLPPRSGPTRAGDAFPTGSRATAPFTPTIGVDRAGLGGALDQRPLVVGDWKMERTGTLYFNPSAFELPAHGTLAPTGRNFMRLPGTNTWDLSLAKDFRLYAERSK